MKLMKPEYGGLGLFLLVYLYVFFKHYSDTKKTLNAKVETMPPLRLIQELSSMGWEILGTGIIVFLVLAALVLTCFRALSTVALGIAIDFSSVRMAFGWALDRRLLVALFASTVLSSIVISGLTFACRKALTPAIKPKKDVAAKTFGDQLVVAARYAGYGIRRALLPVAANTQSAHDSLVQAALLSNLLVVAMTVIMVYSDVSPHHALPRSIMGPIEPTQFTLQDYAKALVGEQ